MSHALGGSAHGMSDGLEGWLNNNQSKKPRMLLLGFRVQRVLLALGHNHLPKAPSNRQVGCW